ncbi:MAG TPA: tetratricopeptide repeat protein [Parvularculaceae bacterium]|nr:tetratricopeptide repeat protein [Parvularculaceae bacterium]
MRLFLLALLGVGLAAPAALADQTDPRLDALFEELRTGDAISAEATTQRIVDIWAQSSSDTVNILYQRALASADKGDDDLALALLDHVIGLAPHFMEGYAMRGVIRLNEKDQSGAIADFSRAIELEPRQFEVRIALAQILLANNAKRDAYDMLERALEWNPHDEDARRKARALRRQLDGQEI